MQRDPVRSWRFRFILSAIGYSGLMETGTTTPQSAGSFDDRTRHRVLLIADEVARGQDLAEELTTHVDRGPEAVEVFVVAPAIADTALDQELGNIDPALPEARERLGSII